MRRRYQYLKRLFFLSNRPIHFHVNSTSVTRPVAQKKLHFSNIEIDKSLSALVYCISDQIQVQKPILVVVTDQMPDHTYSSE